MSQNQDVYRKVGRGGAGNFYPSNATTKDDANKDVEAQYPDPSTQPSISSTASSNNSNAWARAGRGGAGNFVDPATAKEQQRVEEVVTASAAASSGVAGGSGGLSRMALGGRGGAGNYHQKIQEEMEEEAEKKKLEDIEKGVVKAVDEGLKMPPKAKLASGDRA